ncbi:acyl-CoA oxidase [Mycena maculata]|uniref:Acyl-CoA oxidase n=1 Tax=Mycena maculata TaxID=230809 RepID=A0AAD7MZL5_9AGAR|nr:acyl-CoA oxidase [Mycena maculata]
MNTVDGAAAALWTIHLNLACGTLPQYAAKCTEKRELCRTILALEVSSFQGTLYATEVGHGLDSQNIETRAELLPDVSFEIHTPNSRAAKSIHAPAGGTPKIAVVMARLIAKGQNYGSMRQGISCRPLPDRSGTRPIGHAITTFNHVKLPATAFVGDIKSTLHPRIQFLTSIWRLGIGSATMAALCIPALRVATYITTQYAKRRMVENSQGMVVPILSFRTTQVPILRALCQAAVLEAFYKEIRPHFSAAEDLDLSAVVNIRNGLAVLFKTLSVHHYRESSITLTDRLGAQGLFTENPLVSLGKIRGMTIAEGDISVICIRLASELLLGRYSLPASRHPKCLLALHEQAVRAEMRGLLKSMNNRHRSEDVNRLLLPRSMALIIAIGHAVIQDHAWYMESGVSSRKDAMAADRFLNDSGSELYVTAPVISASSWDNYVATLPLLECAKSLRSNPQ